jgi:hypothetical protein
VRLRVGLGRSLSGWAGDDGVRGGRAKGVGSRFVECAMSLSGVDELDERTTRKKVFQLAGIVDVSFEHCIRLCGSI